MRRLAAFLVVMAALDAACGGATATPSSATGPQLTPVATAGAAASLVASTATTPAKTQVPSPSPEAISARVTFDGAKCAYTGPTNIPFPADLTIDYAPSEAQKTSWVAIFAIHTDASPEALSSDPSNPDIGVGTPAWVYLETAMFWQGPGSVRYRAGQAQDNPMGTMRLASGKLYSRFEVVCVPTIPGKPVGGYTVLNVIDTTAAAPSPTAP